MRTELMSVYRALAEIKVDIYSDTRNFYGLNSQVTTNSFSRM